MRARFFNAVSSFTLGFMAGCIAAENSLDNYSEDSIIPQELFEILKMFRGSQFQFINSLYMARYVREEFTRGRPHETYLSNNLGFFLGYEYTLRNAQAAQLEGTLPRWWRSGPK